MGFNSLQTGKRNQSKKFTRYYLMVSGFNSLQTGKRNQSSISEGEWFFADIRFQFPSNGKA